MKTTVLPTSIATSLTRALQELQRGGLVAFPTDTVYGLGALVDDAEAVQQLYVVKRRPIEKAIPVLVGQLDDVIKVAVDIPPEAKQLMETFWPGALTLVLPKLSLVPDVVSRGDTIAVRMPDHPWLLSLLSASGPLAVTSANRSGKHHSLTGSYVLAALSGEINLLIDGGDAPSSLPSTIVDCTRNPFAILRTGPISGIRINQTLRDQQC